MKLHSFSVPIAAVAMLIMWLLGSTGVQARVLYGDDGLIGDLDGDGDREYISLYPYSKSGQRRYQIHVTNGQGQELWRSSLDAPEAKFTEGAVACLLLDVDGDSRPELVFAGNGSLASGQAGANATYRWKNGQFTYSHSFWLVRSADDTSVFLMTRNPKQGTEVLHLAYNDEAQITLGNLHRDVDDELYGDILINGDLLGSDCDEYFCGDDDYGQTIKYVSAVKLKLGKSFVRAVESVYEAARGGWLQTTLNNGPYPHFSTASGVNVSTITAITQQLNRTLKADLNHDGRPEIVRFVEYYPCTKHSARYQIVVSDGQKQLWSSPPVRLKNPNVKSCRGSFNLLQAGQGGTIAYPSEHTFLADIDGDGHTELVIDNSCRYGNFIEVWRWQEGKFNFVRIGSLVQRHPDSKVFHWVNNPKDSRLGWYYRGCSNLDAKQKQQLKIVTDKDGGFNCLYDLYLKNGVVCGYVGDPNLGETTPVRTKVVPGGLQILEKRESNRARYKRFMLNL